MALTSDYRQTQPSAAVVGAGIAGVHVAHELAKIGFQVTVFEEKHEAGNGETRYALPFVGVGLLEPSLFDTQLRREVFRGLLFPTSNPSVISRDHFLQTLVSPTLLRWIWGRRCGSYTREEVMQHTNNLSQLSVAAVKDLAREYPELQAHIHSTSSSVGALALTSVVGTETSVVPAKTAHESPLFISPVEWTRQLADICTRRYGVQFRFGERVEESNVYLRYNVERTRSVTISRVDPETQKRVFSEDSFDVVVLAAGANTGKITWQSTALPIVGLQGCALMLANPTGALGESIRKLFAFDTATTSWRPSLLSLAPSCQLFGYRLPKEHASVGATSTADERYGFLGLLSLDQIDTTTERRPQQQLLGRMENYLRVKCNLEVPLVEEAEAHASLRTAVYRRAFTPDGVPIIDRCGASYNTYVCSGFGDHGPDFAPGAARIISKLVEEYANRMHADTIDILATSDAALARKASVVPPRIQELQDDLRQLFKGELPPSSTSRAAAPTAGGGGGGFRECLPRWTQDISSRLFPASHSAPVCPITTLKEELDSAKVPREDVPNPFSTSRFGDLVKHKVENTRHRFILDRLFQGEDEMMKRIEPVSIALRKRLTEYAARDDTPAFVRSIAYFYFYYEDDSEDGVQRAQRAERGAAVARSIQFREEALHQQELREQSAIEQQSRAREEAVEQRIRRLYSDAK